MAGVLAIKFRFFTILLICRFEIKIDRKIYFLSIILYSLSFGVVGYSFRGQSSVPGTPFYVSQMEGGKIPLHCLAGQKGSEKVGQASSTTALTKLYGWIDLRLCYGIMGHQTSVKLFHLHVNVWLLGAMLTNQTPRTNHTQPLLISNRTTLLSQHLFSSSS